ncbi:MAG: SDR family oxidoreductase, partial [Halomonadaceae bacterium]|nr:SDR family oxidoreductase [Halomonadaceae bacterium]
ISGVYLALQAAARRQQTQGSGRIVNIASAHGLRTTAERSTYAMCKGAILALTRALAVELGPQGILVNAVAPGPVSIGMQDATLESRQRWQAATPLGRVASADEVARTAVFLASRDNTFINGETIVIDGGAHVAM